MSRSVSSGPVRRTMTVLAAVLAVVLLASACSSSKKSPTTTSGAGSANAVDIKNFAFSPSTLTVKVGTAVTWTFDDSAAHALKADDGSFTSNALSGGKTFSFTFNKAGTYSYICSIHTYMKGQIVVQ